MRNNASNPINANRTETISFFLGLFCEKKHRAVETIMVPPVTMGYCTEVSTWASAMTRKKFATLLIAPEAAATPLLFHVMGEAFCPRKNKSRISPDKTIEQTALQIE